MTMPQQYQPNFAGAVALAQPARKQQGISLLVHGASKKGKSSLADSGPRPTMILDVEGTAYWTPSRKVYWDPLRETVPVWDGGWDSAVVLAKDRRTIDAAYRVLDSGRHPFNSVSVDSISEMQQRIINELAGIGAMKQDQWGALLRQVCTITRQWRDLITHPVKPIWTVTFTAGTYYDNRTGKWRPLVQGQSRDFLPYYVDLLGYLDAAPDGTRYLFTGSHPQYETGERIQGLLPATMPLGYASRVPGWTMESMLSYVLSATQGR
jgi:AAA domain